MRGGRSLLVLVVLALGLGAYIYFVESKRDPADTEETKEQAFDVAAGDMTELTIRATSGETTTLRKIGETWSLVEPVAAPVDTAAVDSILSSLETMEIDRVLEETPANLVPFGLEAPGLQVSFTTAAGARHQLSIGNATATSSGLYARVDDKPRLLLVPAFLKDTFDKAPFDLRDRRAINVTRDAIARVALAPRAGQRADHTHQFVLRDERGERLQRERPVHAEEDHAQARCHERPSPGSP